MNTTNRRSLRGNRIAIVQNQEEKVRYTKWLNQPATQRYLAVALDEVKQGTVNASSPLAAQEALAKLKMDEGAQLLIDVLMNLDDPTNLVAADDNEISASWGTGE